MCISSHSILLVKLYFDAYSARLIWVFSTCKVFVFPSIKHD